MRHLKWLIAAGLIAATTAACQDPYYGYRNTAYAGYYPSGYSNTGYAPYYGRYYEQRPYAYRSSYYNPYYYRYP